MLLRGASLQFGDERLHVSYTVRMPMTQWETRRVATSELDRVTAVLARAFQDDPMWRWALGKDATDERRARLERFFDGIARILHARHELTYTAGDVAGAAVWMPPGSGSSRLVDEARLAPTVLGAFGATGTVRLLKLLTGVERVHLREPHYYLFAIGADRATRPRRRLGAARADAGALRRREDAGVPRVVEPGEHSVLPSPRLQPQLRARLRRQRV